MISTFNNALKILFENHRNYVLPYTYSSENQIFEKSTSLPDEYDLNSIILNDSWLYNDIKKCLENGWSNNEIGRVYSNKYGDIPYENDARSSDVNWNLRVKNSLHLLEKDRSDYSILHIGSDRVIEPSIFTEFSSKTTYVDISKELLNSIEHEGPRVEKIQCSVNFLDQKVQEKVDLIIALRVMSSVSVIPKHAINSICNTVKTGGGILLSISNGYRMIDNSVIPGQIHGSPAKINFDTPLSFAFSILKHLHLEGIRGLFLIPTTSEIILGGIKGKHSVVQERDFPLFWEDFDNVPLHFYSEELPTSWLGNFSNHKIILDGEIWNSVEHYFQCKKFDNYDIVKKIKRAHTAKKAKAIAWHFDLEKKGEWHEIKRSVMFRVVKAKFEQSVELKSALKKTNKRDIAELTQDDLYWGRNLNGEGYNMMGKILMYLRENL